MALKTLVNDPPLFARQMVEFLQKMAHQKRDFALAMLVPSQSGLSDKWNFVVSAPWIDREGLGETIPTITSLLLKHLSKVNAHKLERVSVLPTNDPLVAAMASLHVPLGSVHLVQYFPQAEGAMVLVAEPPETSRSYQQQPVQTRA
jgi:hypothetical protein